MAEFLNKIKKITDQGRKNYTTKEIKDIKEQILLSAEYGKCSYTHIGKLSDNTIEYLSKEGFNIIKSSGYLCPEYEIIW